MAAGKQQGFFTGHDPTRGSVQGGFKISRIGSSRVGSRGFKISRVGSGQVNRLQNLAGRVRSRGFKISRVGSGRVGSRGFQIFAGRVGS